MIDWMTQTERGYDAMFWRGCLFIAVAFAIASPHIPKDLAAYATIIVGGLGFSFSLLAIWHLRSWARGEPVGELDGGADR